MKFLHSVGAAGLIGGLGALAVIMVLNPSSTAATGAMATLCTWIVGPSMVLTVIAGLLAIAVNPGFHEAGWAWAKAATGILIFEGCLHVMGPIGEEAKRGAGALATGASSPGTAAALAGEANTLWVMLAVCVANIALAIWRPRLPRMLG